jgi:hypothetical protein
MRGELRGLAVRKHERVLVRLLRIEAALDAQRNRVGRALAERRGQIDDNALHRAFDDPRRAVGAKLERERPIGAARQPIERRQRELALEQRGVRVAARIDAHETIRAAGVAVHVEMHRPADRFGGDVARAHRGLGEPELAGHLVERGHAAEMDLVRIERVVAGDLERRIARDRHFELERKRAVAGCDSVARHMADPSADRARFGVAEEIRRRPRRFAVDAQHAMRAA